MAALYGPMPVRSAIERCEALLAEVRSDRRTEGLIVGVLAELYAMAGEIDRARDAYRRAHAALSQLGRSVLASATAVNSWRVEWLAGDAAATEAELRRDILGLEQLGKKYVRSTLVAALAHVRCAQGDDIEAEALTRTAEQLAAEDDVEPQAHWRGTRATILARRGDHLRPMPSSPKRWPWSPAPTH